MVYNFAKLQKILCRFTVNLFGVGYCSWKWTSLHSRIALFLQTEPVSFFFCTSGHLVGFALVASSILPIYWSQLTHKCCGCLIKSIKSIALSNFTETAGRSLVNQKKTQERTFFASKAMERDRMKEPIDRQVEGSREDPAVTFFLICENWCTLKVLSFSEHDDTFSSSYLWSCKVSQFSCKHFISLKGIAIEIASVTF